MSNGKGTLFVVATPIGNLGDITSRACAVLSEVDLVLAEDTRHSGHLLQNLGIRTSLQSLHDFNERAKADPIIKRLENGERMALISDAGTPLLCDPGFYLVRRAIEQSINVVPVPGPCALTAALSVAGLPTDRFLFTGFAPERRVARRKLLESLASFTSTLVFYEVPHRILDFLEDALVAFGEGREACIAREMTKRFESIYRDSLGRIAPYLAAHPDQQRGEFVVMIHGADPPDNTPPEEMVRLLQVLLRNSLSVKQAVAIAGEIQGGHHRELYRLALDLAKGL